MPCINADRRSLGSHTMSGLRMISLACKAHIANPSRIATDCTASTPAISQQAKRTGSKGGFGISRHDVPEAERSVSRVDGGVSAAVDQLPAVALDGDRVRTGVTAAVADATPLPGDGER